MNLKAPLVLPDDIVIISVQELPKELREQIQHSDGDYVISRPLGRAPSKIVDAQAADLIREFKTPTTLSQAIIRYSLPRQLDPEQTLVEAFSLVGGLLSARLLVPEGSEEVHQIRPSLELGAQFADFQVLRCVQAMTDTEIYQARGDGGVLAALKIARNGSDTIVAALLEREAAILTGLDGDVNPELLATGRLDDRAYLAIKWCEGIGADAAADQFRATEAWKALTSLCGAILDAYAHLHAQGVIHSDVHPRNVLVAEDGAITIVDYGLARLEGAGDHLKRAPRGGVSFLLEPEYASAVQAGRHPPASARAGEQYALAALVYYLLTGAQYTDFSPEQERMLQQIAHDPPVPFSRRGLRPWPEIESVLGRALRKAPARRFRSVAEFAARFKRARPDRPEETAGARGPAILEEFEREVLQRVAPGGTTFDGEVALPAVNTGAAGIAYGLSRIAAARGDPQLLAVADLWSARAARDGQNPEAFHDPAMDLTSETIGQVSLYHTASGIHCVRALIGHAMGDMVSLGEAAEAFVATSNSPCDNLDLTLGRSGTLVGCALVLNALRAAPFLDGGPIEQLGNEVMRGIWTEIATYAPIRECPEMSLLGVAHGWAGVLYATLQWCQVSRAAVPAGVTERLRQLAELAEPVGHGVRWARSLDTRGSAPWSEYVPSWCNGTAGFVYLWTMAHATLGEPKFLSLAEGAAWNAWEHPDTYGDLCCGCAGRSYALLNFYRYVGDRSWLTRANELAACAVKAIQVHRLAADSLYKGEVGVAVLIADLGQPEASRMPLFEEEGWSAAPVRNTQ